MKIFNIASKQSGMLLWKQGCHGNDDWRVTEETTVAMETASQWAIFEASEKKHAPSLIIVYVCRKKKKAPWLFSARVSCIDNENDSRLVPAFTRRRLRIKIA